jgi:GNAT superfamily N-acetyltransferase
MTAGTTGFCVVSTSGNRVNNFFLKLLKYWKMNARCGALSAPSAPLKLNDCDIIRKANDADLKRIRDWLAGEDAAGVEDGFFCNWEVIHRSHLEGELLVYIERLTGEPIGFQLGGLLSPGILQVRSDSRRKGIGRKLVEHCIEEARKNDNPFLFIDCEPRSSIPFWKRMGFSMFKGENGENFGYRVLSKKYKLPAGQPIDVTIRFYSEDRKWNERVEPRSSFDVTARRTADGVIHLPERVSFFERIHPNARDVVVEIIADGERLYLDKGKRPEGTRIGIVRVSEGYYIDQITRMPRPKNDHLR